MKIPTQVTRNVPDDAAAYPFAVTPSPNIDTLYANAGTVNLRADRSQERTVPWAASTPAPLRKLTHFRAPGLGDPMWSGRCIYDLAGASPSFSVYDAADVYEKDSGLGAQIRHNVFRSYQRIDVNEPSLTRNPRVSALRDSAPAATFFQGTFNARWSGMFGGWFHPRVAPRPLHSNFNPGQMGTKELHKATQYQPVPPMGAIVGYFGVEGKAL